MAGVTKMDCDGTKTNRHAMRCVPKRCGKAANVDEANSQFQGVFERRGPGGQNGEGPREGTDDRATSIWKGRKHHTRPGS